MPCPIIIVLMTTLANRYRLYPTRKQEETMNSWLESLRWLYNTALAERRDEWRYGRRRVSGDQQRAALPRLKRREPGLSIIHSQVLQDVIFRLDKAFAAFFRRTRDGGGKPGYPRFRGEGRYRSFTYRQATAFRILAGENKIRLGRLGNVKLRYHRPLEGMPNTALVIRYPSGKWYVCICCKLPDVPARDVPITGFDLGLSNYLTSSDGAVTKPLKALKKTEKKLKREQRRLSRKQKGSKNRCKQRIRLARVHEHVASQRRDFLHKASRRVVDSHGGFAFEKLQIKNMLRNHSLAKAIADAGWSTFLSMVAYKAERAGKPFVLVDPHNTTQICSRCGVIVPKKLSVRVHECPECATVLDRDHNAAINIASRAGMVLSYARGEATTANGDSHSQVASTKREAPPAETG
jgi:putative transposase